MFLIGHLPGNQNQRYYSFVYTFLTLAVLPEAEEEVDTASSEESSDLGSYHSIDSIPASLEESLTR